MTSTGSAIDVSHLTKAYGSTVALNDVTLSVGTGEVRGLLGPNGSGKSSLMKTIMALTKPSYGTIHVLGYDVRANPMEIKKIVGYVPESPRLYEFLTATEYLDFIADVRGIPYEQKKERIARFVDALDLEGKQGDMISSYFQGMKQKVPIIGALLHRPLSLPMDEPFNGLDPKQPRLVK